MLVLGPAKLQSEDREAILGKARRLAAAHGITLLDDAGLVIRWMRCMGATLSTDFRLHGTDHATVEAALEAASLGFERLDVRRN